MPSDADTELGERMRRRKKRNQSLEDIGLLVIPHIFQSNLLTYR